MTTIIDTDALIGWIVSDDSHHESANRLRIQMLNTDTEIFILPSTLGEFGAIVGRKIGLAATQAAIRMFTDACTLLSMNERLTREALRLYDEQTALKNSLSDCYVATAARFTIDTVFSFDKWYTDLGLVLIEDFFKIEHSTLQE